MAATGGDVRQGPVRVVVNVRALVDPKELDAAVRAALIATCESCHVTAEVSALESFRPAYPRPSFRDTEPVPS